MTTNETPETPPTPPRPDEPDEPNPAGRRPWWSQADTQLTASDVKTYATLGHVGTALIALVHFPLMWVPALALFLVFRRRDQAGLLRRHLAQAVSFSAVLTVYGLVVHYGLAAGDVDDLAFDLLPPVLALVAAVPAYLAVQAARRLQPFTYPKALAWIPVE